MRTLRLGGSGSGSGRNGESLEQHEVGPDEPICGDCMHVAQMRCEILQQRQR
jgi:hypothetical protein